MPQCFVFSKESRQSGVTLPVRSHGHVHVVLLPKAFFGPLEIFLFPLGGEEGLQYLGPASRTPAGLGENQEYVQVKFEKRAAIFRESPVWPSGTLEGVRAGQWVHPPLLQYAEPYQLVRGDISRLCFIQRLPSPTDYYTLPFRRSDYL